MPDSPPGIGLDSRSPSDRRYNRPSATNTMRVPSGDTASARRDTVSWALPGIAIANRVTGAAGAAGRGHSAMATAAIVAAAARPSAPDVTHRVGAGDVRTGAAAREGCLSTN